MQVKLTAQVQERMGWIFSCLRKNDLGKGKRTCFMLLFLEPGQLFNIFASFNLQSDLEKFVMKTTLMSLILKIWNPSAGHRLPQLLGL